MTIAIATGQTRTAPCDCCAVLVKQSQHQHAPGGVHWSSPNHDASCGLPCLGGGVGPRAYRLGEFHRSPERCPRCAPGSNPRRNERDDGPLGGSP